MPKPPPHDQSDKAEESADPNPAMERFKSLASGLLRVPKDELAEAERREREKGAGDKPDAHTLPD